MQNYQDLKVDLINCDKEPIHIIGRIQSHGFLLVIDSHTYIIEQISQNIGDFIPGADFQQLLGKSVWELLPEGSKKWFEEAFLTSGYDLIDLGKQRFFGFNHVSGDKIIVECEPFSDSSDNEKLKQLDKLSALMAQLNQLEDPVDMANLVAKEMLEYLDYDRVNVMRFDKKCNSEVIGESLKGNANSFMGHHFPASDIPLAARKLLLQKTIRHIPDVNAAAVEITPYINPSTGSPTDILKSELRNPSEIHLEYLRNMEVSSTISFSIIAKGNLWGLISCHNYKPVFVDVWKRRMCFLMTQSLASEITSIQKSADLKEYKELTQQRLSVVERLEKQKDLATGLTEGHLNISGITQSGGAAVMLNQKLYTYGITPTEVEIKNIIAWFALHTDQNFYSTRCLWKAFPEALMYKDTACGLLALEISKYNQEYLLFFKPEIARTRIWAGNPEKPELEDDDYIHPRKSFEKWEETVKGKSVKWNHNELEVAKIFVKDLTAFQLRDQDSSLKLLYSKLEKTAQKLMVKNTQLEDFGLIMAHNLRAPMNNILLLHQFYEEEPTEANAQYVFQKIPSLVDNMIKTMGDLNQIINTRLEEQLPSDEVSLPKLIDKEWNNLQTEETESLGAQLHLDLQVPIFYLPRIYAESILHNFISNALKYQAKDRPLQLKVQSWQEEENIFLSISDNGLGMDLNRVGGRLFGLYQTFHHHHQAKGMGLYLTKMQIEALGGTISVESEPDIGTTFTICFPKTRGVDQ